MPAPLSFLLNPSSLVFPLSIPPSFLLSVPVSVTVLRTITHVLHTQHMTTQHVSVCFNVTDVLHTQHMTTQHVSVCFNVTDVLHTAYDHTTCISVF